jgi:hypothetical protein
MVHTDPAEPNLLMMLNRKVERNQKKVNGNVRNAPRERKQTVNSERKKPARMESFGINHHKAKDLRPNVNILKVLQTEERDQKKENQGKKLNAKVNLTDQKDRQKLNVKTANLSVKKIVRELNQEHA